MFGDLKRPYKDSNTEATINKIKEILGEIDLVPEESFHANPYPQIFSVRLELGEEKGSFGTNGKGRTREYSLASGYAEFMERMQNNLYATFSRTLLNKIKNTHGFYYAPDEHYITREEFFNLPEKIFTDIIRYRNDDKTAFINALYDRLERNGAPGIVGIPFYDTRNKNIVHLPYNLLVMAVGSNGMAAGNTVAEAIFQGLCELMERWGAAEVFYNQLTPPTVPESFLQQFTEEYKIIRNITESGKYSVTIKDFSASKKIPTVGIIITNNELKKYRLNVGSDTSFQVALSRCLTEVYQGIESNDRFDEILLNIPTENPEYFKNDDEQSIYRRYMEYASFTRDNSGVFPVSLFSSQPSYPFDPDAFITQESYEKEVRKIITNFHERGYDVYIKDVSFLGFPSVMVYVPEISALGRKNVPITSTDHKYNIVELDKVEDLIFDFESLSENQLKEIERTLSGISPKTLLGEIFNVKFKKKSIWGGVPLSFFLAQLRYRLGDYEGALESIEFFRKNRKKDHSYYHTVTEYIKYKISGMDHKSILKKLSESEIEKNILEQACSDMMEPKDVFKYMKFPKCPNCGECSLKGECLTRIQFTITHRLYSKMKENIIDQNSLSWVVAG